MRHTLCVGIGDVELDQTLRAVANLPPFLQPPASLKLDDETTADVADWANAITRCKSEGLANWGRASSGEYKLVTVYKLATVRGNRVNVQAPDAFETLEEAVAVIEAIPFMVASVGSIHIDSWGEMDAKRVGFGDRHYSHGWACAFRGKGHDYLASRRWLDFGPWRVIRRPGDLTIVQFHDLAADAETAYAQALPGWERMGISVMGGYLQSPYTFRTVEGLYHADTRLLEVVVPPGGKVKPLQMRDAAAVRLRHPSGRDEGKRSLNDMSPGARSAMTRLGVEPAGRDELAIGPVERVALVFLDEAGAREHLHELWLRDLEVWLVDGDGKRRLDVDHHPAPTKPAWVAALEE